jgi:hypothetical protein
MVNKPWKLTPKDIQCGSKATHCNTCDKGCMIIAHAAQKKLLEYQVAEINKARVSMSIIAVKWWVESLLKDFEVKE